MSRPTIGSKKIEMILIEYFETDLRVSEIARKYGVSRTSVNWYAKNYSGGRVYPAPNRKRKSVKAKKLTSKGFLVAYSILKKVGFKKGDRIQATQAIDKATGEPSGVLITKK